MHTDRHTDRNISDRHYITLKACFESLTQEGLVELLFAAKNFDPPPSILDIRCCPMIQETGDHLGVVVEAGHVQAGDPVLALVTHFVPLLQ